METPKTQAYYANKWRMLFGVLLLIGLCLWAYMYMHDQQLKITKAYDSQLAQTERTTATINQLYRFVHLTPAAKEILVKPRFEYANANGIWFLVNKNSSIGLGYAPKNLVPVPMAVYRNDSSIQVRSELVNPLKALDTAAQKDGVSLMVRSAYRSSAEQQTLLQQTDNSEYVAPAGYSEHQTGLAVDFNDRSSICTNSCSLSSDSASWLATHAASFGFILRYPEGKASITGYPPENWHYRYVGLPLALAITQSSKTYEEVYPLLDNAQSRHEK